MTFLDYYKTNLAHIRHLGAEFAAEFPKIASRLDLDGFDCADPYVERILEGTAFLAARVENKIESGHPRLLESMLSSIAPTALNNLPSHCVLEIRQKDKNCSFPSGTRFQTVIPGVKTPCTFTSMEDFHYSAVSLSSLEYSVRDLPQFSFTEKGGLSTAAMQFGPVVKPVDSIDFFVDLPDGIASRVLELFTIDLHKVFTVHPDGKLIDLTNEVRTSLPMFERRSHGLEKIVTAGLRDLQQFLNSPDIFKF